MVQSEDLPAAPVTPNLEPPPLDPEVEQAAKGIAKRILTLGRVNIDHVYRNLMRPRTGLVFTKAVLGHAVEQGWITRDGDWISPGSPLPVPPPEPERSSRELRAAWGPGAGRDW